MSRLELRGVIVPSDYDATWAQSYIERGILTPESYFRRKLDAADKKQPLDVYVNSPGGSVFAANEMVNAVRDWKMANNQPVNVTVGAMAASAASAFTIMAADTVRAHKNAKMMFHGAWTVSIGGKELHQDTADLLGKINADIKARLVSKYNLSPEVVSTWFAEGREGWLTAEEMKASGIAGDIIEDPADTIQFPTDAIGDIEQRGIGIAALLKVNAVEDKPNDGADTKPNEHANNAPAPVEPVATIVEPPAPAEPSSERIAGREEGRQEAVAQYADEVNKLKARIENAEATARTMQSERDKAIAANVKAREQHDLSLKDVSERLKAATDRLAKFLDGGLSFSPTINTWEEAMKACGGDYASAAQKYPELRREYNKKNQPK